MAPWVRANLPGNWSGVFPGATSFLIGDYTSPTGELGSDYRVLFSDPMPTYYDQFFIIWQLDAPVYKSPVALVESTKVKRRDEIFTTALSAILSVALVPVGVALGSRRRRARTAG